MQRWLAFLETKSVNDMLVRWGGEWDFLGDWLWPGAEGVNGDTRETLFYNNCYWVYNLRAAARIAGTLGLAEAAKKYGERAESVRKAVHAKFFNPGDNSYVNGFPAYLSIALLVDLPPEELRPAVWSRLEREILVVRKGHIHAGITGGAFLFTTLMESNRNDLICTMVSKEDYPGWGDMLKRGATTFYEDWEAKLSYLHSSYLYVGSWFIEGLGGIRHPQAGFKQFVIEPWIDSRQGPRQVKAHYDSPYGRIETRWTVKAKHARLNVTVPPNTEAVLRLNSVDPRTVREGGHAISSGSLSAGGSSVRLRLEPGRYEFETQLVP